MIEAIFLLIGGMVLFLIVVDGVLQALSNMIEQAQSAASRFLEGINDD